MKNKLYLFVLLAIGLVPIGFCTAPKGPIKAGMYADISAATAQWGKDSVEGAKVRVKELDRAGGLLGRKVELVVYDCKLSPTEALKAYTRLVNENRVAAVYVSLISNTGLGGSPAAEQMKVSAVARCMDERVTTRTLSRKTRKGVGAGKPLLIKKVGKDINEG